MSLLQDLIQDGEPSLTGLAVHRLRREAAAAWPRPGASLVPLYVRSSQPWYQDTHMYGYQNHARDDLEQELCALGNPPNLFSCQLWGPMFALSVILLCRWHTLGSVGSCQR